MFFLVISRSTLSSEMQPGEWESTGGDRVDDSGVGGQEVRGVGEELVYSEGACELDALAGGDGLDVDEDGEDVVALVLAEDEAFFVDELHLLGLVVVLDGFVVVLRVDGRHEDLDVAVDEFRLRVAEDG